MIYYHKNEEGRDGIWYKGGKARERGMAMIASFEEDMDIIQKLSDNPNDTLSAAELKSKFDEAGNLIKDYLNDVLIPAIPSVSIGSVVLTSGWTGNDPYSQGVIVVGVQTTAKSHVELRPTAAQLASFYAAGGKGMMVENNNGALTVYAFGAAPEMTILCHVTEVG